MYTFSTTGHPQGGNSIFRRAIIVAAICAPLASACMPAPDETIWLPEGHQGAVHMVMQGFLDDGTDKPIHALQLRVPPVAQTSFRFVLDEDSIVSAGTLSADESGHLGADSSAPTIVEFLPAGSYDLEVSSPSGTDILLGGKPVPGVPVGEVGTQSAPLLATWLISFVYKAVAKRIAQYGLSSICGYARGIYESYGNRCPIEFGTPPLCIVGYGLTCGRDAQ